MFKPKLGDTIRYVTPMTYADYEGINPLKPMPRTNATFIRWHDQMNIVVSVDGVEKIISAEYLM